MSTLELSLKSIVDPNQKGDVCDALLDGALSYEHVSGVEGAPDG